jgi:site-specific recombinase XerD
VPRKGKRKKLAVGIYEDGTGRAAVCLGKEKRFPPHTPLSILRDWQQKIRKKLKGSGRTKVLRGTLAEAVNEWAGLEQHLTSWKERRAELRAWVKLYGDVARHQLDSTDVRAAMGQWAQAGVAPKTIRNRLWTLRHLYKILDGPDADTPVDHVEPPAKVRQVITPVMPETILKVYRKLIEFEREGRLRDARTRAIFMVRAATGRRPVEIMRAKPEDVDLDRRIWRIRDAKGGWSEGQYLNDDMLTAWRTFVEADAWGEFNTGSMAEVLRAAGWPKGIRPYNLRHSIGIGLSELGHDLADVGGWLGHRDLRTTRSAYVPILQGRMQRLSESLAGRLQGWNGATSGATIDRANEGKSVRNKDRSKSARKAKPRGKAQ